MTSMTTQSMAPAKWALSLFSILALAFFLTFAVGAAPAYAEETNPPVASDNAAVMSVDADQIQSTLADPVAEPVASAVDTSAPAVDAPAPSADPVDATYASDAGEGAPAPTTAQGDLEEPSGNAVLTPADASPYPGDDGTAPVFVGLAPEYSVSYDLATLTTSRDPVTNALHVYLSSEVGKGVNLEVAVDYLRIGSAVYDARSAGFVTLTLPSADTSEYTMRSFAEGLMYTWYVNGSPLGQGTYYSDPTTNPALAGGGIAGATSLAGYEGVSIEDFMNNRTWLWKVDPAKFNEAGWFRFYKNVTYVYDPFDGTIKLRYPNTGESHFAASDSYRNRISPLYFETPGERTVAVQFTYVQEYRSKNTVDENVGYVLYASNPVVFHISIAPASVGPANMAIIATDAATHEMIDITSSDFLVDLEKDYLDEYARYGEWGGGDYEWLPYAYTSISGDTYAVATKGLYRLTVTHVTNLYKKYVEYFILSDREIASGSYFKFIDLEQNVPAAQYSVTFYWDDGVTIIPVSGTDESGNYVTVDSRLYNEETVGNVVWKPAHPVKPATEYAKYVFEEWKPYSADDGTALEYSGWSYDYVYPVLCNTKYIAVFRTIPLKNNAGKSIVYATGGLFSSDAKPAGVLAYELTSVPLTASEASSVIAAHSDIMSADTVLGMVNVDLTQYNDDADNTTTDVTEHEGLEGMKLKFNMAESGIAANDGDKLKILQIHKKDESSPEEILEHKATVENGEVEITLEGKLSTFVFLMDDTSSGGEGTEGGTTNPEQGGTSGEGGSGEGSSTSGESSGEPGDTGGEDTGGGTTVPEQGGTSGEGATPGETGSGANESTNGESSGGSSEGTPSEVGSSNGESASESSGESANPAVADSETDVEPAYAQDASEITSATSESDKGEVSSVKSASAAAGSSMPATSDSMSSLTFALAALAELAAAVALCAYARRRTQL